MDDLKKLNENIETAVQQYQDLIDEKPGASEPDMSTLTAPAPLSTTPRATPTATLNHNFNSASAFTPKPEATKDAFADFGSFGNDNGFADFGATASASAADPFGGSAVTNVTVSADPFGNSDPFASITTTSTSGFGDGGFGKEDPFAKDDPFKSADPFAGSDPFKDSTPRADNDPFAGNDPFSSNANASATSASNWTASSGLDSLSRPKVCMLYVVALGHICLQYSLF